MLLRGARESQDKISRLSIGLSKDAMGWGVRTTMPDGDFQVAKTLSSLSDPSCMIGPRRVFEPKLLSKHV